MTRIHIDGRRWFQRSAGNTYHSVRIFKDGELAFNSGRHYGYGDCYLQTAWEWLKSQGIVTEEYGGTRALREDLGATYSVSDVSREKDL